MWSETVARRSTGAQSSTDAVSRVHLAARERTG
jgi:hypothetical protein